MATIVKLFVILHPPSQLHVFPSPTCQKTRFDPKHFGDFFLRLNVMQEHVTQCQYVGLTLMYMRVICLL